MMKFCQLIITVFTVSCSCLAVKGLYTDQITSYDPANVVDDYITDFYEELLSNRDFTEFRSSIPGKVHFNLFTRRFSTTPQLVSLRSSQSDLDAASFNSSKQTNIFIHGYLKISNVPMHKILFQELLNAEDCNLLVVDWSEANDVYDLAVVAVEEVGKVTAELIQHLSKLAGLNSSTVHIIGQGMGVHIAGIVGGNLDIGRITGLDAQGPGFINSDDKQRLDYYDAEYVYCIVTSSCLGFKYINCDAIFYVNGGKNQPGCSLVDLSNKNIPATVTLSCSKSVEVCNHNLALVAFTYSIMNEEAFPAYRCRSFPNESGDECELKASRYMGFRDGSEEYNVYFVQTSSELGLHF